MQSLNLDGVESSYRANDYGALFYALVRTHRPRLVVELGTYMGYSALHMAAAIRDDVSMAMTPIFCIDMWDQYPHRHCSRQDARSADWPATVDVRFPQADVTDPVTAYAFQDGSIDLLQAVFDAWRWKLSPDALVIIEGGSAERDRVEWMVKYGKKSIRDWLASEYVSSNFTWVTLDPFPSVTLMRPK